MLLICWALMLCSCFPAYANFPPGFDGLGVLNPSLEHQRWRGKELSPSPSSSPPYFQWWFWWFRGPVKGSHLAVMYGISSAYSPPSHRGSYLGFAFVDADGTKGFRSDHVQFDMSRAVPPLYMALSTGQGSAILPLSNNSWHLTGNMSSTADSFYSTKSLAGVDIEWDVKVTRNSGWYGEAGIIDHLADSAGRGMISWNPYGHDSNVAGTVKFGGNVYTLDGQRNAYADMNWGLTFPMWKPGTRWPESDYAWGWYSMADPSTNSSFIIGLGLAETGFPLYSVFGGFADFSINGGALHVTARSVGGLYDTPERVGLIELASDGKLVTFNVTRSQYHNFTDDLGTVAIPLQQDLLIVTRDSVFKCSCVATIERTNRMLMAFQDITFSDFETLGASCTFSLTTNGNVVVQAVDDEAGVEYGRQVSLAI